jgi:hypothetical protein
LRAREQAEKAERATRDQSEKARAADRERLIKEVEKAREQADRAREQAERQRATERVRAADALQRGSIRRAEANSLVTTEYTLPASKANALAAFLKTHLKASVVEANVDGDKLTVTTTPEAQKAIKQLIGLIPTGGDPVKPRPEPRKSETNLQFDVKPPTAAKP